MTRHFRERRTPRPIGVFGFGETAGGELGGGQHRVIKLARQPAVVSFAEKRHNLVFLGGLWVYHSA